MTPANQPGGEARPFGRFQAGSFRANEYDDRRDEWLDLALLGLSVVAGGLFVLLLPAFVIIYWLCSFVGQSPGPLTLWLGGIFFTVLVFGALFAITRSVRIAGIVYYTIALFTTVGLLFGHFVLYKHFPQLLVSALFFRGTTAEVMVQNGVLEQKSGLGNTPQEIKDLYGDPHYFIDYSPDGLLYAWGNWPAFPSDPAAKNMVLQVSFVDLDGSTTLRAGLLSYLMVDGSDLPQDLIERVKASNTAGGDPQDPNSTVWHDRGNGVFVRGDNKIRIGFIHGHKSLQVEYFEGVNHYSTGTLQGLIAKTAAIKAMAERLSGK